MALRTFAQCHFHQVETLVAARNATSWSDLPDTMALLAVTGRFSWCPEWAIYLRPYAYSTGLLAEIGISKIGPACWSLIVCEAIRCKIDQVSV